MESVSEQFEFLDMDEATAVTIADEWHYSPPYDFYDVTADVEDHVEFVDPSLWTGPRYQARNDGQLIGFLTLEPDAGCVEIGLGLRPDLTGRGLGRAFVEACLRQIRATDPNANKVKLSVAAFNERAITTYTHAGFERSGTRIIDTNGGAHLFVDMVLVLR